MTTTEPIYEALARLQHADIPAADREMLRPAFAALDGAEAIALTEMMIETIFRLDHDLGGNAK